MSSTPRRWADRAVVALLTVALGALAALAVGSATGHRLLVVRSGSMAPAIAAGDAVVVRRTRPASVQVGDVITFADPESGRLLTHRVREAEDRTAAFAFTTQGDANTGVERWTMPAADTLGAVVVRLPKTGYLLAGLSSPAMRSGLLVAAGLLGASVALRRIWAR